MCVKTEEKGASYPQAADVHATLESLHIQRTEPQCTQTGNATGTHCFSFMIVMCAWHGGSAGCIRGKAKHRGGESGVCGDAMETRSTSRPHMPFSWSCSMTIGRLRVTRHVCSVCLARTSLSYVHLHASRSPVCSPPPRPYRAPPCAPPPSTSRLIREACLSKAHRADKYGE